ncbi:hypothetical protein R6Q59_026458 [Mikania micrantha]
MEVYSGRSVHCKRPALMVVVSSGDRLAVAWREACDGATAEQAAGGSIRCAVEEGDDDEDEDDEDDEEDEDEDKEDKDEDDDIS